MNAWARIEYGTPLTNPAIALHAFTEPKQPQTNLSVARHEVKFLLRGLGTPMNFAKGTTIFIAGGNANAVFRVVSGAVALWRAMPNGKRHIVDFRLKGEFFGVIHRPTETINAEATSDCIVTAYRRGQVDEICDAVPSFRRSVTALTAEPVMSRGEAAEAEGRTARERIAELLLRVAERAEECGEIALPFSTNDIGDSIMLRANWSQMGFALLRAQARSCAPAMAA
jgi:CRP-like cAMP-binding protein